MDKHSCFVDSIDQGTGGKLLKAYFLFKDGYYYLPADRYFQIDPARFPNGECEKFTQIEKLQHNLNTGDYIAYLKIYEIFGEDNNFQGDRYRESLRELRQHNAKEDMPDLWSKAKAVIQGQHDGRYILVEYMKN